MQKIWKLGTELKPSAQAEAKACFVHRWTHENAKQSYGGKCPGCEQSTRSGRIITGGVPGIPLKEWTREEWHAYHVPLLTDEQWLAHTQFAVTKSGDIDRQVNYCIQHRPHPGGLKAETVNA